MLKVYIIEDDSNYRRSIIKATNEIKYELKDELNLDIEIMFSVRNVKELLYSIDTSERNIYILNVVLNCEIDGVELAELIRKIDKNGLVIFMTSYKEIGKYKDEKGMKEVILEDGYNNIKRCVKESLLKIFENIRLGESITVNVNGNDVSIFKNDILFFRKLKEYIVLHTYKEKYIFYGNIKNIKKQVGNEFMLFNSEILINRSKIKSIDKLSRVIIMDNDEKIKLSFYTYYKEYRKIINIANNEDKLI